MKQSQEIQSSKLILVELEAYPITLFISYGFSESTLDEEIKRYELDLEVDDPEESFNYVQDGSNFLIHIPKYQEMEESYFIRESVIISGIIAQKILNYLSIRSKDTLPYLTSNIMMKVWENKPSEKLKMISPDPDISKFIGENFWELVGEDEESEKSEDQEDRQGDISDIERFQSERLNRSLGKVETLTLDKSKSEVVNSLTPDNGEKSLSSKDKDIKSAKDFLEFLKYLKGEEPQQEDD